MPSLHRRTLHRRTLHRRTLLAGIGAALAAPALPARAAEIRIAHAMGETVLPAPAARVVSLGFTTHDTVLALGVQPLAVRYWYGEAPGAIWPWAQPLIEGPAPEVLTGEVSAERVAALAPDLIVGIGSGISRAEYDLLSQIAPVLMQPEGQPAYGLPWAGATRLIGHALGREDRAEALIGETHAAIAEMRARHPGWIGRSAAAAYHFGGDTGAFTARDNRTRLLTDLGFVLPPQIEALAAPEGFYAPLSPEDLSPLDADLLLWIAGQENLADIAALPMRRVLAAHREGREALAAGDLAAALSFASVLSIPYALERLEPELAAALDGDPATLPPAAEAAGLTA
ncbi:iron-siderophore ABC transporter substrate-binding protein [Frigidibacter sp. MR17.24]|uniref:iron-siderophore ABC transporter substrate-binding protein n=1 Tax=Frigidibacter sp. MR17.24 TaxID=3127345 RepID=UPI003012FCDC